MSQRPRGNGRRALVLATSVLALGLVVAACGGGSSGKRGSGSSPQQLVGTFKIDPGLCSSGVVTQGSYFRMIQSGGKPGTGPFVPNGDSTCKDKTWSALFPGTAGGFVTGRFQPNPQPAFDKAGNGLAADITRPTKWFAASFTLSTDSIDPQTKSGTTAPTVTDVAGTLAGDLRAFSAAWNGVYFNQGAPKPDGTRPGNTSGPTGSYNASTHHYTLEWTSQIVGGPFNGFTGVWHLEGTFVAGAA